MPRRIWDELRTAGHRVWRWSLLVAVMLGGLAIAVTPASAQSQSDKAAPSPAGDEIAGFPGLSASQDWPWWRGPERNGHARTAVPTKFSPTEQVLWKAAVPGRGHSSPIVVKNAVYLTTADEGQQRHRVLAFGRANGKVLWDVELNRGGFPANNHPKNTEATPSVACDGERLFVTLFHHQQIEVIALDFQGKVLWRQIAGPFNPRRYEYGYAPSPLLYKNTVIVIGEYDGESFLTALDRKTGKPVWKSPRPNNISFSSPVVANVAGREQLLLSGGEQVSSYNPANGKPLWSVAGTTFATCGTLVWDGDLVFASGGYPKAETVGVNAKGKGQVLWRNNQKCYEQSMIVVDGHIYALTDNGVLFCWRGRDGQELWKQRLTGPISASPVYAGGHIYWANELGTMYVFRPNPEKWDPVAENQIGNDSFASPAIAGGQLFLRTADRSDNARQETLWAFGTR
jgi:outer membrane protein assembly factor BamB